MTLALPVRLTAQHSVLTPRCIRLDRPRHLQPDADRAGCQAANVNGPAELLAAVGAPRSVEDGAGPATALTEAVGPAADGRGEASCDSPAAPVEAGGELRQPNVFVGTTDPNLSSSYLLGTSVTREAHVTVRCNAFVLLTAVHSATARSALRAGTFQQCCLRGCARSRQRD